jgi:homoserine kinase type II
MAVYTILDRRTATSVAESYGLGKLTQVTGVPAGSVNTLYLLETTRGKYFLKIDEAKSMTDARRELELLQFLRAHGLRCPQPLTDRHGQLLRPYHGKPLSLTFPLSGKALGETQLTSAHLTHVGQLLASLHLLSEHAPAGGENRFSFSRISALYQQVRDHLPGYFKQILHTLDDEVTHQQEYQDDRLPKGLIHGDLFADNLLFRGDKIVGLLDFEAACHGKFLFDLATAINALCYSDGHYVSERFDALLAGYQSRRPLSLVEWDAFPNELRFSALRFTVTRLKDFFLHPMDDRNRVNKDFREFLERLQVLRRERSGGMDRLLLAMAIGYDYRQYQRPPAQHGKPAGRKCAVGKRGGGRQRQGSIDHRKARRSLQTAR